MILVSGTVRSATKLAQLNNKWEQKKSEGNILKKEMDPQARQIQQFKEDLAKMRENDKMSEITTKIRSGSDLTPEELDYLKRNNPSAYKDYLEIKQEKENYEKELRGCKTKDEVERLKVTRLGQFAAEAKQIKNNPYIPEGKKVQLMAKILAKTMGIEKIHLEFTRTAAYQNLPTEEELAEEQTESMESAPQSEEAAESAEAGSGSPETESGEPEKSSEGAVKDDGADSAEHAKLPAPDDYMLKQEKRNGAVALTNENS